MPFDVLLDRRKRSEFLNALAQGLETPTRPKVVQDAGIALASLVVCEEALEQELIISTSYVLSSPFPFTAGSFMKVMHIYTHPLTNKFLYNIYDSLIVSLANVKCSHPCYVFRYVPGMEVTLSSRLKSLYSIYSKVLMHFIVQYV